MEPEFRLSKFELGLIPLSSPVLREADLVPERLVAHLAGEGPLPVVRPPGVHLQPVRGGEDLLALEARVDVASAQRQGPGVADGLAGGRAADGGRDRQRRVE